MFICRLFVVEIVLVICRLFFVGIVVVWVIRIIIIRIVFILGINLGNSAVLGRFVPQDMEVRLD